MGGCMSSNAPQYDTPEDEAAFNQWNNTFLGLLKSNESIGFEVNASNIFLKIEAFIASLKDNPNMMQLLLKKLECDKELNSAEFNDQLLAIVNTNKLKAICTKGDKFNFNANGGFKIESDSYYILYLSAWNGINEIIAEFNNTLNVEKMYNQKQPLTNMRWETWMTMYYFK